MTKIVSGKGVEITQYELQQILLRGKGDSSFAEIVNKEITRETARTYDLISQIINEVADPVRSLSAKYLDSHYPKGMRLLRWYFDKKIK